jgi:hypothetical protein
MWILVISTVLVSVSLFAVVVLTSALLWFARKLAVPELLQAKVSSLDAEVLVLRKEVNVLRTSKAGTISNAKRAAAKRQDDRSEDMESEESATSSSPLEAPTLFSKNQMRDLLLLKVPPRANPS